MISLLFCSCDINLNNNTTASTTAPSTTATSEPEENSPPAPKHDAPTADEIDLSDADIENFEETDTHTDYVVIKVAGYGDILVRLFPEVAPKTVANFKDLVGNKFYDGLIFHRVIKNFMIQGGAFDTSLAHHPASPITGEFNSNGFENNLAHVEGVLSMARADDKNSASSQFFIMHKTSPHLDGDYAAFGYAADGRDVVDAIAKVDTNANDQPIQNIVIESIRFVEEKDEPSNPIPGGPEDPGPENPGGDDNNEPPANTTLSIEAAIALGNSKEQNTFTEGKYYVSGVITSIASTMYGNMTISDGTNEIYVYGTFDADGTNRFDAMANQPKVGDTVTVYGVIGFYNMAELKNAWIVEIIPGDEGGEDEPADINGLEEGVAYKIYMEQVNLGYTLYALNTTQDNANKFINVTLDPKEGADFYIEIVEGGCKIYTDIDGVKHYLIATAVLKDNGSYVKSIGFATESDSVFFYDAATTTFMTVIDGNTYGVGTYLSFETISLSESKYYKNDNINVVNGQFPIGFIPSEEAEKIEPDDRPTTNDPEPNTTLTIEAAIALGNSKEQGIFTESKYYVSGVITSITSTMYGNMTISDGTNEIYVYGTFDADGTNRFDAMANQPKVGDTVTVYGIIGFYNMAELKNAWIVEIIPGEEGGDDEGGEDLPANSYITVDSPEAGVAYKFGMYQANVGNTFFLAGGMNGYYMATIDDASAGIDVYLETTDGGYYLYTMNGETKLYINMIVSGTHVNGAYEEAPSTVYTFDTSSKTLIATVTVNDARANYWFGTRNDMSYTTVGPCAVEFAGFYCQFYEAI